jgi:DNA modification methylase
VSVFEIDRPKASPDHPTSKPVALVAAHIRNSSVALGIAYDPFCGGGTTLIAAEQLDRRCYAIEIEPTYCQVTIDRWEAFTGQKAKRVD